MNELLFFILGYIIGALSGIAFICFFVISKQYSKDEELMEIEKDDVICAEEK